MKLSHLALLLILALFTPTPALPGEIETYHDNLLQQRGSFEDVSLAQIYLALPQQLFECTYQQRITGLINGRVEFRAEKKELFYGGDGGQMSLTVRVTTQTKDKLVLHVTGTDESEGKVFYQLERIPNGWKAQVTFPEDK